MEGVAGLTLMRLAVRPQAVMKQTREEEVVVVEQTQEQVVVHQHQQ